MHSLTRWRWRSVLRVFLLLVAVFGLVWFLLNKDAVIHSAEMHEGTAAWVQAIGALLAIFATWFLSDLQRQQTEAKQTVEMDREQRRRGDRIHAVANLIGLSVSRVRAYVERVDMMVSETDYGVSLGKYSQKEVLDHLKLPYEPPEDIIQAVELLPRTAAKDILQLFFFIKTYNLYVEDWTPTAPKFFGSLRSEYIEKFELKLNAVKKLLDETWKDLVPYFEEHNAPDASGPKPSI